MAHDMQDFLSIWHFSWTAFKIIKIFPAECNNWGVHDDMVKIDVNSFMCKTLILVITQ